MPPSRPAPPNCISRASGRSTTRTISARSSGTRTATTSKPCATNPGNRSAVEPGRLEEAVEAVDVGVELGVLLRGHLSVRQRDELLEHADRGRVTGRVRVGRLAQGQIG